MNGMLWFDNTPRPLAAKLIEAVTFYNGKYGGVPGLAWCNPADYPASCTGELAGLRLEAKRFVMPNHLLVGAKDGET
jgi:hypothetical protein